MQKSLESYSSMVSSGIPPLQNPTDDNQLLSSIRLEITENPSFSSEDSSESKPADDVKSTHKTHQTVTECSLQVQNKKRGEEDAHHQEKRACTNTSSTVPTAKKSVGTTTTVEDDGGSGRERLKRHRVEVAGRVWIPDMWAQETCLKDWIDCTAFDASLVNSSIMSARDSLVEEARRASSSRLRILN